MEYGNYDENIVSDVSSSIFNTLYFAGGAIGPIIGSALTSQFNFTFSVTFSSLVLFTVSIFYLLVFIRIDKIICYPFNMYIYSLRIYNKMLGK